MKTNITLILLNVLVFGALLFAFNTTTQELQAPEVQKQYLEQSLNYECYGYDATAHVAFDTPYTELCVEYYQDLIDNVK